MVRNAAATLDPIVAAEVAAAVWVVIAAVVVSEAEAEAFGEVVAVANGRVGRFRAEVTFPTRGPAGSTMGRCQAQLVTHEPAARVSKTWQAFAPQ